MQYKQTLFNQHAPWQRGRGRAGHSLPHNIDTKVHISFAGFLPRSGPRLRFSV